MTETERAGKIAGDTRRRFLRTVVIIVALLLSLTALFVAWHNTQQRAETAETSAVSLAERVQERCETEGSFLVGDRDLCRDADDVVEGAPVTVGPAGAQGPQGERGYTGATGPQGRTGPPGEVGPPGPVGPRGPRGDTGDAGAIGATGATGETGPMGPQGETGAIGPQGEIGPQGLPGADSTVPGPQGIRGPQGTARPGDYACPDGAYMTGFSIDVDGGVKLACTQPVLGPPVPTPTP